ncbi:dihydrofolate reductase family protein [Parasphingorhabdus litoris]|uniref:Dihydrofolate reductase family protein n=1 Tax=Parasphingorhabdus litoris TaxID=394733 RepID=A0ABP3K9J4_9SPHN|nr:dihydrofolate reductase family protein [Parasphingorhabdus litoris]
MIRGFIAVSADGFVADNEGGVGWLEPFNSVDYGYDLFVSEIEAVVLGRITYEQILSFEAGWPYARKQGFIVTSSPLNIPFADVQTWHDSVPALAKELKEKSLDSWVVGGPKLQTAFIEQGLLDRLELFVVPVLLGGGTPLYRSTKAIRHLQLDQTQVYDKGMVKLDYRIAS